MNILPIDDCFVFVINTDSYVEENFEQEMCGYTVGVYSENGCGLNEAEMFEGECPDYYELGDSIALFPNINNCWCPSSVWGCNDKDVAIFFKIKPTNKQLDFMMDRAKKFIVMAGSKILISGFELQRYNVVRTNKIISSWKVPDEDNIA